MKFFDAIKARVSGGATPGPTPAARPPASGPRRAPRAAVDDLALRCATKLADDTFADLDRVKWVLLQPEVAAACRRFSSLAALGEKRADETREAREALRAILVTDLPAEWPEHIEMLLDLMQTTARGGTSHPVSAGQTPPRDTRDALGAQTATAEVAEARIPEPESAPAPTDVGPAIPDAPAPPEDEPRQGGWPAENARPGDSAMTPVEYELRVLPGTSMEDVDVELVREYVQGAIRRRQSTPLSEIGTVEVLRTLKAADGPAGRERLTVLGGLFFARQPERLVVQSKVRFVEFTGVEVATSGETVAYRYTEEVTGTIPQLIARMERIHKERLAPGVLADGFRVEEVPAVPLFALREAIVNAVCHRDYGLVGANIQVRLFADRLEVQSPGGLPGPVTVENIISESYARNPRTADMLRDLGYVERHGLGIDNMIKSMEEAHLPPPEFNNCETSFTVILRFRLPDEADPESWLADIGAGNLTHEQQKALVFARRAGRIVNADYRSLNPAEADEQLRALVRGGWLVQNGTRGEAHYTLGPSSGSPRGEERNANPLPQTVIDSLPASQRRVLDIVARQGRAKASEVLEISALKDRRTIQRALAALTQRGLLVRRASSRTDPNATYEVNPEFEHNDPQPRD